MLAWPASPVRCEEASKAEQNEGHHDAASTALAFCLLEKTHCRDRRLAQSVHRRSLPHSNGDSLARAQLGDNSRFSLPVNKLPKAQSRSGKPRKTCFARVTYRVDFKLCSNYVRPILMGA